MSIIKIISIKQYTLAVYYTSADCYKILNSLPKKLINDRLPTMTNIHTEHLIDTEYVERIYDSRFAPPF